MSETKQEETSAPPPVKAPKPPKPVVTPHENGRDILLCSPAFATLWVDGQYCIVGGGGGGKKYELPNALAVVNVSNPTNKKKTDAYSGENHFWEIVTTLDFEEAGTIQTISDSFAVSPITDPMTRIVHFVVTHIDSFSLVRYTRNAQTKKISLCTVCRVALNTDPLNADTKPVTIVSLSPQIGGPLIFASQDNQTVAVFRLSTLVDWANREAALKSAENVAVAKTVEDVKNQALTVCEFPTGGRLCDIKTKILNTTVPQTPNDVCIVIAICTRDKSLLVGHFDPQDRKFVPAKKFTSEDFGFTKDFVMKGEKKGNPPPFPVMLTGKSIRTCQFSSSAPSQHFSSEEVGKFTGVSTDLFVALQPLKMPVCAARIKISNKKSSIETLTVRADGLVKSRCTEPPATSTMLPQLSSSSSRKEDAFCIATVEGSLVEFIFDQHLDDGTVRRFIPGFHADAVTCMSISGQLQQQGNNNKTVTTQNRLVASSDIARRVAFHTFDPLSRSFTTKTTESMMKNSTLPDLFTQEMSAASMAKQRKKTIVRWVLFCIFGLILALIAKFVLTMLGVELI